MRQVGARNQMQKRNGRYAVPVAAVLLCVATAALAGKSDREPPGDRRMANAAQDFATYCAMCHGASGHGEGELTEELAVQAPDLTTLMKRNDGTFPARRVREMIDGRRHVNAHPEREMPVLGRWFTRLVRLREGRSKAESEAAAAARIDALVDYLRALQE